MYQSSEENLEIGTSPSTDAGGTTLPVGGLVSESKAEAEAFSVNSAEEDIDPRTVNPFGNDGLEFINVLGPKWWERSLQSSERVPTSDEIEHGNSTEEKTIPNEAIFTSLGDLLDEPEEDTSWVIEGLLPASGFSIMAAKPKVGKSTLARQAALAVAQGEVFMGRQTTKGTVLYLALEEKRSEVRRHFKSLGASGKEGVLVYVGSVPKDAQAWLERGIKSRKPVLVIIDTLFRFVTIKNGNDYAEVTAALTPILSLARENGAHLMVIHHARKGGGDSGDSMLGSTAIFGSVDTAIILKRTENNRTIETQQRYGKDIESTILIFDEETQTTSLGGTKEEEDIQNIEDEMLSFLSFQTQPCMEKDVVDGVEGRTGNKRKALRFLVAKGQVQREGTGKRNDPYFYSCSLVPDIYTEQEKQESELEESSDNSSAYSRSEDTAIPTAEGAA